MTSPGLSETFYARLQRCASVRKWPVCEWRGKCSLQRLDRAAAVCRRAKSKAYAPEFPTVYGDRPRRSGIRPAGATALKTGAAVAGGGRGRRAAVGEFRIELAGIARQNPRRAAAAAGSDAARLGRSAE